MENKKNEITIRNSVAEVIYNRADAERHALTEFEKYRVIRDRLFESDYDRFIAQLNMLEEKTYVNSQSKFHSSRQVDFRLENQWK